LPTRHVYTLEPGRPTPGRHNLLRPPIALQIGAGILTRFPSTTALALILGADSPCADERGAGNLGLTASRPFTCFIATHVSIRTSDTSSRVHTPPSQAYGTLSYHPDAPLSALRFAVAHRSAASPDSTWGAHCASRTKHHARRPLAEAAILSLRFGLAPPCARAQAVVGAR
jgi:hypothetical protein